jgi:hypothetical protein
LQAAQRLEARAVTVGFTGLDVEARGCHDYAVVLHGLRDLNQAREFSAETESVGLHVRIECRSHPAEGTGRRCSAIVEPKRPHCG